MPCYHPWTPKDGHRVRPLACGQCIGCRLEQSRKWAMRCIDEAQMHKHNAFVTLTYELEPKDGSLEYKDFQAFMKRLRRRLEPQQIRFYAAGEYGERLQRPHWHALLFGAEFADKLYYRQSPGGGKLYTSNLLEAAWGHGFTSIGDVTFESAAYVARYVMKKRTGAGADAHYSAPDENGEIKKKRPEMANMSRKPGIGEKWIKKYMTDVYPHGNKVINGKETTPPRYYDEIYKKHEPEKHAEMKDARQKKGYEQRGETEPDRLKARETVKRAQLNQLKRTLK